MEVSLERNFKENREQFLDDVDEIMDYVFGEYPFCEEHDDSSEVKNTSKVAGNSAKVQIIE